MERDTKTGNKSAIFRVAEKAPIFVVTFMRWVLVMFFAFRPRSRVCGLLIRQASFCTARGGRPASLGILRAAEFKEADNRPLALAVGAEIGARVLSFGPLGASVEVLLKGRARAEEEEQPLESQILDPRALSGLITQVEISLFREARGGDDVLVGDVLPAWVHNVRDDGRVDVGLRPAVRERVTAAQAALLEALEASPDGVLPVGDKSDPGLIRRWLPGVSKSQFKNAVGGLYRSGMVLAGRDSVTLVPEGERAELAAKMAAKMAAKPSTSARASNKDNILKSARILSPKGVEAVLVTGLPYKVSGKDVEGLFAKAGAPDGVVSGLLGDDGRPSGRAVVKFSTGNPENTELEAAIASACALDQAEFGGRTIRVRPFYAQRPAPGPVASTRRPATDPEKAKGEQFRLARLSGAVAGGGARAKAARGNRGGAQARETGCCVFFGNLPYGLRENDLVEEIEAIVGDGKVTEVRPSPHGDYCHVDFVSSNDAAMAVREMSSFPINGRPLRVDIAR